MTERRMNAALRQHVDLVAWMVEAYLMDAERAVKTLMNAGLSPRRAQRTVLDALNRRPH